jgi:hypothetical protein
VASAGPTLVGQFPDWEANVERVGFVVNDETVSLLYTCATPVTTPLMGPDLQPSSDPGPAEGWTELLNIATADRAGGGLEREVAAQVLDHWRQQLEETTAVFELLPKYFTTPQVRSAYDAVWGAKQDPGNFHKWLHAENSGVCALADRARISADMQKAARRVWAKSALLKVAPGLSVANLGPRLVGTSPLLGAGPVAAIGGVAALAGGVALAGAVAGGLIAYQTTRSPGKQPEWYTRCGEQRTVLGVLYAPRPDWLKQGYVAR